MMSSESLKIRKVREQLHYFNIHSDVDSVYGDWAVTKEGDLVNFVYPFAIFSSIINECNWLDNIRSKVWYDVVSDEETRSAFNRAKELSNFNVKR